MDDFIESTPVRRIESPCVNSCALDRATGRCTGCGRTLDEIARWMSGTDAWRDAVMAMLPGRMARF